MKEFLEDQGKFITISSVVLILSIGIWLIDGREDWRLPAIALGSILVILFLFMNARNTLKAIISSIIAIVGASFGFQLGLALNPGGTTASVWFLLYLFLFFITLAISYLIPSGKNRWTSIGITQILAWIFIYVGVSATLSNWGIVIGVGAGLLYFLLTYAIIPNKFRNNKLMPSPHLDREWAKSVLKTAGNKGWGGTEFLGKNNTGYVLLWDKEDNKSYLIYPVHFEHNLGMIGKKKPRISYQGKNINPWLQRTYYSIMGNQALRGIVPLIFLYDYNSKTGNTTRMIGMGSPDYKTPIPIGLLPEKAVKSSILKNLEEYSQYANKLKPRMLARLNKNDETVENLEPADNKIKEEVRK